MATKKPNQSILYNGTATPYMALFDSGGMPIMNVITGIPLGAYISNWSYKYDDVYTPLQPLVLQESYFCCCRHTLQVPPSHQCL